MGRPSFRACQSDRSARRRRDNILARHQNSQRRLEPTGQLLPRPATAAGNTLGVRSQRRTRTKQSFESDQRSHGGRALVPTGLMGTASRKPIQLSRGRAATPPMDLVYEEATTEERRAILVHLVDQVYLKHGAVLGIRPTLCAWPLMHAVYAQSLQSVGWWAGWVSGRPFKHTPSDSDVRGAAKESRAGKRLWITNTLSRYSCTHLYPQAQAFL